jgi:hypothetical protein
MSDPDPASQPLEVGQYPSGVGPGRPRAGDGLVGAVEQVNPG